MGRIHPFEYNPEHGISPLQHGCERVQSSLAEHTSFAALYPLRNLGPGFGFRFGVGFVFECGIEFGLELRFGFGFGL